MVHQQGQLFRVLLMPGSYSNAFSEATTANSE